jgi:hypothetical protein
MLVTLDLEKNLFCRRSTFCWRIKTFLGQFFAGTKTNQIVWKTGFPGINFPEKKMPKNILIA